MNVRIFNFCRFSLVLTALTAMAGGAIAAQAPNPRGAGASVSSARGDVHERDTATVTSSAAASRAATRRATAPVSARSGSGNVVTAPSSVGARSAVRSATVPGVSRAGTSTVRAANSTAIRSAVPTASSSVRSATNVSRSAQSRAGTARATAVFTDISKIGGGYATCREAYATCMDQFCANANDTYRRCFCSSRFTDFRQTEAALDEAKTMLMRFNDNNLNAVTMTAAEVNAMYTATAGEQAIKNDTSGAAAMLAEIGDLLSGKKKAVPTTTPSSSLGILDLDFSTDIGDIWGDGGDSSIFSSNNSVDMSTLEGQELYSNANKQCLQLINDSCENDAVLNMARSAYNIMITQDCNAYEKKLNSQREQVASTVRTAEKYLREARLEEYREHNSADVNECLDKVRSAMTTDTACGANYKRCLDPSGIYINQNTGEPIYSTRLFELNDSITLNGANDVLAQNPNFNSFLESRKMFATAALDSCRDISAMVWEEFKRAALIEISQAQDAKIEEVKMSCVSTMKECYDTQSGALKSFDDTTAQAAGALSVYAAKEMCKDKVIACASLYGNTDGCEFDGNGRMKKGNSSSSLVQSSELCGLTALLSFVDSVDTVRVAEGCASAIDNYVTELCTPTSGDRGFPWNCRTKKIGDTTDKVGGSINDSLAANIVKFAIDNCSDPTDPADDFSKLPAQTRVQVQKAITDIEEQLDYQLMEVCEDLDGYWLGVDAKASENMGDDLGAFYTNVYGGQKNYSLGRCVENTTMIQCLNYNTDEQTPIASYDRARDECTFTDAWYKMKCETMNGYYENGVCYVAK